MVSRLPAIYRIVHSASGKCYVGSSINYKRRWYLHRSDLRHNRHHSLLLQRAWNKYGEAAFIWEVLEMVEAEKTVLETREQHWIDTLQPAYNRSLSVNRHFLGQKRGRLKQETIEKIRTANTGYRHTSEAKARMSAWQKGSKKTLTPKQRAVAAETGRRNILRAQTPEARAKMAAKQRGRTMSAITCQKKSAALKGKPWSAARRAATPLSPRHTRTPRRVITPAQATEICTRYAVGGVSQRALAREYGFSQEAIWRCIKDGKKALLAEGTKWSDR